MTDEKMRNKKVPLGNNTRKHILINPLKIVACISQQVKCVMQFLEGEGKMQTAEQLQEFTNGNNPKISGYQLLTLLSRNMGRLKLKQAEALTFMALASYWNGKPIYPKIKTLCENTNLSDKAVRNAIKSLVEQGYLLKSKRGKNANIYNIVLSTVLSTVDTGTKYRTRPVPDTAPCNMKSYHEKLEQQHEETPPESESKKADVVSLSSFSLKKIPASILAKKTDKNDRPIRNHAAYWNSLTDAQKREYLKQEKENAAKTRKKEELKRQAQIEKQRQREEEKKLQEQLSRPLHEQWTQEQAIKHVWLTRNFHKGTLKEGLTKSLVELYSLNIQAICKMTEEEIEKIS